MAPLLRSPHARWAVPAAAAAVLIGVGPLVHAMTANAQGSLPPRTAAQLLADVGQARVHALSGTVVETTNLGLPALPSIGGQGGDAASFSSLVSGSHTMRVWYAGPDHQRLALLGQLGESDLVHHGTDVWSWSSRSNTATHWTVPAAEEGVTGTPGPDTSAGAALTPQQAAGAALRAIDPSTRVRTDPRTVTVAGRSAYVLSLMPRDSRSLVGSVRIAIDGRSHIPTRVQVFAKGASSPAFQVGFTSLSTSTPDNSVFGFTAPPGATVKHGTLPTKSGKHAHLLPTGATVPTVIGKGWTGVVVATLPADTTTSRQPSQLQGMLDKLPTVSGSWGSGHLLRSTIFSAVLTDDGRVAIGAVGPQLLYDALSRR